MAKKIRFPLEMENGVEVRSLEELQNNFSLEKVMGYYINGRLNIWLRDRYMDEMAIKVAELDKNKDNFAEKLCEIFGVEYQQSEINMEQLENKNKRLAKIKEYTENESILQNIGNVALNQDELYERLDEGKIKIYLCGERFEIPLSQKGICYIGINKPIVVIPASEEVDFGELEIQFEGIEFDEQYKKIMVPSIDQSIALYSEKQYEKAIDLFEKQAERGNAKAMRYLGLCYENGNGVQSDKKKAYEWYKKGAEAGEPSAMNAVGICYEDGNGVQSNKKKAYEWYKKGAEAGEIYAMANLAYICLYAYGIRDENGMEEKGIYWAEKAAEKDVVRAIKLCLNYYYYHGQYGKIFSLLESKAKAGDITAMNSLGKYYVSDSVHLKPYGNPEKALYWLKKAAEVGDKIAAQLISERYEYGSHGVAQNKAEAQRWRKIAASNSEDYYYYSHNL